MDCIFMEPTLDNASLYWEALADRVETFLEAWEATRRPPPLAEHLPEGPPVLRKMTLVELIKADLEFRWKENAPKTIEEYVAEFPELAGECGPPADLIYEEFHVRCAEGATVGASEYFRRFPNQASRLRRLMGLGDPMTSTALFPRRPVRELNVGETIDDFLILAPLGKGSFASVYLAQQKSMQRRVALKVSPHKGQEGQTLAQLDHNHIVRVFDQRVLREDRVCLLYMQYVAGGTLDDVIDRIRRIPLRERMGTHLLRAVDDVLDQRGENPPLGSSQRNKLEAAAWPVTVCHVGEQLAYALAYAHAQGVLHRDLKPANVLMSADGSPMLADFNISFASQLEGATPAAFFGGSLAYMSPEQLEACNPAHERKPDDLDARSDIYSLGVLLWELLYGKRPWPKEEVDGDWSATLEKFARTRRQEQPQPAEPPGNDPVHRELHAVLKKCLAPEPEDRFASAAELGRELWLCTRPHTQMLLKSPRQGWRSTARRYPVPTFILTILLPHILAAVFNYVYNDTVIIRQVAVTNPDAVAIFTRVAIAINATFFPTGLGLLLWLVWPVHRALTHSPRGKAVDFARRRALRLPLFAAAIGILLWGLAGLAYPLLLPLSWNQGLHFGSSLIVCGLIVSVYPFFLTAYVVVRVFYPALLALSPGEKHDERLLHHLVRDTGWIQRLTVAVPLLGGLMLYVGQKKGVDHPLADFALVLLFLFGLVGVFFSFFMYVRMREDVEALVEAAQSPDTPAARSTLISRTAG